jgi:hypothetical protein
MSSFFMKTVVPVHGVEMKKYFSIVCPVNVLTACHSPG